MSCGDIMYDDLSLYRDYELAVTASGIPFFQVVSNHDLDQTGRTDEASVTTFESHFGRARYSFDRGEVHYVVMDDVLRHGTGYIGYLDDDQLGWLAGDLALVERGRTVIVALHNPLASTLPERSGKAEEAVTTRVNNRDALYRLLEPYHAHVLSGHTHESEHGFGGGVHDHVVGAVCGGWWTGDICYDGTPNGYGVYEVSGSEVRWRYQATGRPAVHQMRLSSRRRPGRAHRHRGQRLGLGSGLDGGVVRGRGAVGVDVAADRTGSRRGPHPRPVPTGRLGAGGSIRCRRSISSTPR